MKVQPITEWRETLEGLVKASPTLPREYFISESNNYAVRGLTFFDYPRIRPESFEILDDYGNLISIPQRLFNIIDDSLPRCWVARRRNGTLCIWPELFFREFFFDDLSERVPDVVRAFADLSFD